MKLQEKKRDREASEKTSGRGGTDEERSDLSGTCVRGSVRRIVPFDGGVTSTLRGW